MTNIITGNYTANMVLSGGWSSTGSKAPREGSIVMKDGKPHKVLSVSIEERPNSADTCYDWEAQVEEMTEADHQAHKDHETRFKGLSTKAFWQKVKDEGYVYETRKSHRSRSRSICPSSLPALDKKAGKPWVTEVELLDSHSSRRYTYSTYLVRKTYDAEYVEAKIREAKDD